MTPDQLREAAAVMMAAADGKTIEFRLRIIGGEKAWNSLANPSFEWGVYEYRIKPEPVKMRVQIFRNGEIRAPFNLGKDVPLGWEPCSDIVEIEVKE